MSRYYFLPHRLTRAELTLSCISVLIQTDTIFFYSNLVLSIKIEVSLTQHFTSRGPPSRQAHTFTQTWGYSLLSVWSSKRWEPLNSETVRYFNHSSLRHHCFYHFDFPSCQVMVEWLKALLNSREAMRKLNDIYLQWV